MGGRGHGLGAVAAAHLAIGRQAVAVVTEYPGAWQDAGRTIRSKAQPSPRSGGDSGDCLWPCLLPVWGAPHAGPELGRRVWSQACPPGLPNAPWVPRAGGTHPRAPGWAQRPKSCAGAAGPPAG